MTEEEKETLEELRMKAITSSAEAPNYPNCIVMKKDLITVSNLIQKQDKVIKNQSYTNKKMKNKLDNYRKLTKFKERTIQKQDTEINKLNNVIDRMAKSILNYDDQLEINYYKDKEHVKETFIEYAMKEDK